MQDTPQIGGDRHRLVQHHLRTPVGDAGGRPAGLASVAIGFGGRAAAALAGLPGADHPGYRRHQKQLPDQHLQDGESLTWVGVRDEVAVPGRGQGGEREEQILGEVTLPLRPEEPGRPAMRPAPGRRTRIPSQPSGRRRSRQEGLGVHGSPQHQSADDDHRRDHIQQAADHGHDPLGDIARDEEIQDRDDRRDNQDRTVTRWRWRCA